MFEQASKRPSPSATVLTSNKSFDEWGQIFGGEVIATARIDRLVHHCHIVNILGNSYRMNNHAHLYNARRGHPCSATKQPSRREADAA